MRSFEFFGLCGCVSLLRERSVWGVRLWVGSRYRFTGASARETVDDRCVLRRDVLVGSLQRMFCLVVSTVVAILVCIVCLSYRWVSAGRGWLRFFVRALGSMTFCNALFWANVYRHLIGIPFVSLFSTKLCISDAIFT